MLDLADFGTNPHAAEFGQFGLCRVRFGKAGKGSAPKRRTVLTVWDWVPGILEQWIAEARPVMAEASRSSALWPSERGVRVGGNMLNKRFAAYRDALGLEPGLDFHSLRRSYVTHLIEDGWDPLFVQLLLSPQMSAHDVQHEPLTGADLRGGGGYLPPSITQIPRRFDACSAGSDARVVA
jgi:hypothetical protein